MPFCCPCCSKYYRPSPTPFPSTCSPKTMAEIASGPPRKRLALSDPGKSELCDAGVYEHNNGGASEIHTRRGCGHQPSPQPTRNLKKEQVSFYFFFSLFPTFCLTFFFKFYLQSFLVDKAKNQKMPTADDAELTAKYLYDDPIFIVHMCHYCRVLNRTIPTSNVDDEHQKIGELMISNCFTCKQLFFFPELVLCRICRSTFKSQRSIKFFKHDLLCVKRNSQKE